MKKYRCPSCGDTEQLSALIPMWHELSQDDDGNVEANIGDWNSEGTQPNFPASCAACDWSGILDECCTKPEGVLDGGAA